MPASARSRPRWRSPVWSLFSSSAPRDSRLWSFTSGASTRHGKRRASLRAVTVPALPPRARSPRPGQPWNCAAMVPSSWPGSPAGRRCCPASPLPRRRFQPPSPALDDSGVATVLAALMVAMLITVTMGGVLIGSAVVARHRAQSAADLAALAAAARITGGPVSACRQAEAVAGAMHATVRRCDIDQLDVIVTVAVAMNGRIGSEASAAARAGPAG